MLRLVFSIASQYTHFTLQHEYCTHTLLSNLSPVWLIPIRSQWSANKTHKKRNVRSCAPHMRLSGVTSQPEVQQVRGWRDNRSLYLVLDNLCVLLTLALAHAVKPCDKGRGGGGLGGLRDTTDTGEHWAPWDNASIALQSIRSWTATGV